MSAADSALDFQTVDILFCKPGNPGRKILRDALSALDAGGTRAEIQDKFGAIVGVAGANLTVARGEI
jgi:ABC-type proline/glycine betaine transport system ATPase subunit